MKKVLFAITNLEIGGAEQVLVRLTSKLSKTHDITILTLYGEGTLEKELDQKVKVQTIYKKKYEAYSKIERYLISMKLKCPLWKKHIFKTFQLNTYDTIISFLEGPMTELLKEVKAKKKIAWIHTDLTTHYPKKKYKSLLKQYTKYDKLIFVSKDSYHKFDEIDQKGTLKNRKQIIYNYVDPDIILKKSKEPCDIKLKKPNFVVVARLVEAKGIDRLMKVHKKLIEEKKLHHIYIVGNGPLKESLLSLQKELKIDETFHFLGEQKNPYPYMMQADYLLLPSHYEGYPVTLIEGMLLNKYIAITDISSKEVLKEYPDHFVMENSEEGIYKGLKKLLKEKPKATSNYQDKQNEQILNQIEELLKEEER